MGRRVYVAGKLNADAVGYLHNCHKMMNTAELLREAGYCPYVPCLDLMMGIAFGWEDYHTYFDLSQPWLAVSEAVFLTAGWETSKGTIREIETAQRLGIPVFDHLDEMWSHFEGVPGGAIMAMDFDADGNVTGLIKERNIPGYSEKVMELPKHKPVRKNPYEVRN